MHNIIITILLLGFTNSVCAKEIDITASKGIDQEVIISLEPKPAQMDVAKNVIIKATFALALDSKSVQKNNIKLKLITEKKESIIDGTIGYIAQDNTVTYQPNQNLDEGYYEIEIKSLKATKANKATKIKEIKYRFYVAEVLNGYMLPPEPYAILNNSTLLGIDFNDNGIRDDLERWIIRKYATSDYPKTKTEIALQWARTTQQVIQSPETAYEDKKYLLIMKANLCQMYSFSEKLQKSGNYRIDNRIFNDEFVDRAFNTKDRIESYARFNGNLAGHVYGSLREDASKCDFDIDEIEE